MTKGTAITNRFESEDDSEATGVAEPGVIGAMTLVVRLSADCWTSPMEFLLPFGDEGAQDSSSESDTSSEHDSVGSTMVALSETIKSTPQISLVNVSISARREGAIQQPRNAEEEQEALQSVLHGAIFPDIRRLRTLTVFSQVAGAPGCPISTFYGLKHVLDKLELHGPTNLVRKVACSAPRKNLRASSLVLNGPSFVELSQDFVERRLGSLTPTTSLTVRSLCIDDLAKACITKNTLVDLRLAYLCPFLEYLRLEDITTSSPPESTCSRNRTSRNDRDPLRDISSLSEASRCTSVDLINVDKRTVGALLGTREAFSDQLNMLRIAKCDLSLVRDLPPCQHLVFERCTAGKGEFRKWLGRVVTGWNGRSLEFTSCEEVDDAFLASLSLPTVEELVLDGSRVAVAPAES